MTLANWRTLAAQVDAVVDQQFGEPIRIEPWRIGAYVDGEPDRTRPVVTTVGIFVTYASQGLSTSGERNTDFMSRMVASDVRLSVLESALQTCKPRKGDRVTLLDTSKHFDIEAVVPDATGRVSIHLIRREP